MTGPATDPRTITQRLRERAVAGVRGVSMPTLDDLKEMLGIPPGDTSQDEEIQDAFETQIARVENFLGRGVVLADEVQPFEPVDTRNPRLMLYRFPVSEVRSVTVDGAAITGWRVFHSSGILEWRNGYGPRGCYGAEPVVSVDYTGGYPDDDWPADLMDAILQAFFVRWHATGDTGNTAEISGQGPIRSVSLDGSAVTWADHFATGAETGAGPIPPELAGVAAILDRYRQRVVTGV